jgi:hypothetical protein
MARVPVIALVGGVGILAAWLAGSAGARSGVVEPVAEPQEQHSQFDPLIDEIRSHASRLERYRATAVPPKRGGRDPFRFASLPRRVARSTVQEPALRESSPVIYVPQLVLIGVAEDRTPDGGSVRTAIISGMGQLFLVGEGQQFAGRFEVVRVGPETATVLDRTTGATALTQTVETFPDTTVGAGASGTPSLRFSPAGAAASFDGQDRFASLR